MDTSGIYSSLILAHLAGSVWGLASRPVVALPGKWGAFNIAPLTKTVYPAAIHFTSGAVTGAELLVGDKDAAALGLTTLVFELVSEPLYSRFVSFILIPC